MPVVKQNNRFKWIPIRSDSYQNIIINIKYKDDNCITQCPSNCPICLNIIWNYDEKFSCERCKINVCSECMENIKEIAELNKVNHTCPYCRYLIKEYTDNIIVNINTNNNNTNTNTIFEVHPFLNIINYQFYINMMLLVLLCFFVIFIIIGIILHTVYYS